jgi:thymidylate kinase
MTKKVFVITGASGTGKTSLVSKLKSKYKKKGWIFLNFDSIRIPTSEEMIKQKGSLEKWQKDMTNSWIRKLIFEYEEASTIIFEGQMNLEFIENAFLKHNYSDYKIVLIDCSKDVMAKRLIKYRNQPELLNRDMEKWLKFLRGQAKKRRAIIIDTSGKTKLEVLKKFEQVLKKFKAI